MISEASLGPDCVNFLIIPASGALNSIKKCFSITIKTMLHSSLIAFNAYTRCPYFSTIGPSKPGNKSFLLLYEVDQKQYPTAQEPRVGQNSFSNLANRQAGWVAFLSLDSKRGLELIDH